MPCSAVFRLYSLESKLKASFATEARGQSVSDALQTALKPTVKQTGGGGGRPAFSLGQLYRCMLLTHGCAMWGSGFRRCANGHWLVFCSKVGGCCFSSRFFLFRWLVC